MIRTLGVTTTEGRVFPAVAAMITILGGAFAKLPPALAQTAEEAVAFFMWGMEEGSRSSPLAANKWAVEDADGRTSAFEIKRVSECRYDVHIQKQLDSDSLWFDYALDFSSVTEYDTWLANSSGRVIIIKIEGIRWYSKKVVNLKNGRVLQMITDGIIDANVATGGSVERLQRAYADFRTNHCRGRAVIGEVVAVDAPNGTITVKHTRIEQAGLNLPEGTHRFRAQSDLLGGHIFNALRPGDEIKFRAARVNGELVFIEVDRAN